jgi:hypothetical protein
MIDAQLSAIELMVQDLQTRHSEIRHKAGFRRCNQELNELQKELLSFLSMKKQNRVAQLSSVPVCQMSQALGKSLKNVVL